MSRFSGPSGATSGAAWRLTRPWRFLGGSGSEIASIWNKRTSRYRRSPAVFAPELRHHDQRIIPAVPTDALPKRALLYEPLRLVQLPRPGVELLDVEPEAARAVLLEGES